MAGTAAEFRLGQREFLQSRAELLIRLTRLEIPVRSPLTSAMKHRHADPRELLGEHLKRDGFAGAGCAGDASVTVGEAGSRGEIEVARFGDYEGSVMAWNRVSRRQDTAVPSASS